MCAFYKIHQAVELFNVKTVFNAYIRMESSKYYKYQFWLEIFLKMVHM